MLFQIQGTLGKRKEEGGKRKMKKSIGGRVATSFVGWPANSSKSSPTLTPIQTCPLDAPPKDKKAKAVFHLQILLFIFEDFSFYKMQSEKNQICSGKG
jgi:hypothetical protein